MGSTEGPTRPEYRYAIDVGLIVGYVLLDWMSFIHPVLNLGITPWSPQAGLALAYLLARGPARIPVVAVAALLAEVVVRDSPAPPAVLMTSSSLIAIIYGVTSRVLGRVAAQSATSLLSNAARFAIIAVLSAFVAANAYVCVFAVGGTLPWSSALESVARYWIGDVNGILMMTPLLLSASGWRASLRDVSRRFVEVSVQATMIAALILVFFRLNTSDHMRFFYPLFVPVIWIACRWGAGGALISVMGIQVGLVIAMHGVQPAEPLVDLQLLMLTLGLTGLLLGAVVRERANALARVATGEAELRALLSTAPDAVMTVSPRGEPAIMNAAARHLFGHTKASEYADLEKLLPGLRLGEAEGRAEIEGRRADGAAFSAEVAWTALHEPARPGWLLIVRDVTESRRAQAEARGRDMMLARAMRFAVAGELASALAHELTQPITALVSYVRAAELLARPVASEANRLTETLGKASNEAVRAAAVLRRLRDFYQGSANQPATVDLRACCETVLRSLESRIRSSGIQYRLECPETGCEIESDSMHIEIVLHNLISNAIDALATVSPYDRHLLIEVTRQAGHAMIVVEDSAQGVSADAMEMLFEPFNTTKPDGMGLGLAISCSLVRGLEGDLTHGRGLRLSGARFCVQLPFTMQVALTRAASDARLP